MHDLGLGGPVSIGKQPDAKHGGPCYDGVYGCHLCWNAANDGEGTKSECDWCHAKDVFTKVTRSVDEPVLYAICDKCIEHQRAYIRRLEDEYDR